MGVWDVVVVGVSEGADCWESSGLTLARDDGVREECIFDGGVCQTNVYEGLSLFGWEVEWVLQLGFIRDKEFRFRVSSAQAKSGFYSRPPSQKSHRDSSPESRAPVVLQTT